jgi:hypothetical protein
MEQATKILRRLAAAKRDGNTAQIKPDERALLKETETERLLAARRLAIKKNFAAGKAVKPDQLAFAGLDHAAAETGGAPMHPYIPLSVNSLWRITKVDRRTIESRLQIHRVLPVAFENLGNRQSPLYDPAAALSAIFFDKDRSAGDGSTANERLSAARAEQIERAIEEERGLRNGELMRTEDVLAIFIPGLRQLDLIRSRAQSELDLNGEQAAALEKMVDGLREDWAEKIQNIKGDEKN